MREAEQIKGLFYETRTTFTQGNLNLDPEKLKRIIKINTLFIDL